jgi:hypothetical protein
VLSALLVAGALVVAVLLDFDALGLLVMLLVTCAAVLLLRRSDAR